MKFLVATKDSNGVRASDFCHCNEGELVRFTSECQSDDEDIDGECGCRRSMGGFDTMKCTTTMKVVQRDFTQREFISMLYHNYVRGGWNKIFGNENDFNEFVLTEAKKLLEVASEFKVGTVLEKRGDIFQKRVKVL